MKVPEFSWPRAFGAFGSTLVLLQEKMFTLVQHVPVESFKGLQTENVRDE